MYLLFILSLLIVGFGQPASFSAMGLVSAVLGFALFFRVLVDIPSPKSRFWLGVLWYSGVQGIQLFWALGHPFYYIYFVYALHLLLLGLQFGLFSLFITRERIQKIPYILGFAGFWVILEWMRLYFFSGHPWNPIGLTLSGSPFSRQFASFWGVYGLSFWVMLVNLLFLRAWLAPRNKAWLTVILLALVPYAYGAVQLQFHSREYVGPQTKVGLVQTTFPIEETMPFSSDDLFEFVKEEWRQILTLSKKAQQENVDLLVLPELVVPYGTYFLLFDYDTTVQTFGEIFGPEAVKQLPGKQQHLSMEVSGKWMVNNAFWLQGIANVVGSDVVAGLEDRDYLGDGKFRHHTVAYLFRPNTVALQRYEKRVLVPMGEYIPFAFLRDLAADYGVHGSFTCGECAKLLHSRCGSLGVSICYEETLGHMMRESRIKGAEMLVNVTNDGWFPDHGLPKTHLEHARLRTVEMGVPLIRSCNTGITCAIDSFGNDIAVLGKTPYEQEHSQDVLIADVPRYQYRTPYTFFGDHLILTLSAAFVSLAIFTSYFERDK
ncbi:MAG: Apolipoprotein N-acyltransferase [Chlamydiae bacterium]|nr:Apolipoprotein N-acyltransferase [Chlamydiota bacterium]